MLIWNRGRIHSRRILLASVLCIGGVTFAAPARSSSSALQESNSPASANSQSNVVVAVGDSLTAGFGASPGKTYPEFLEGDLFHSGYPYRVVNFGRDGATTGYGVNSLSAIEKRKPALVIVILGANDRLAGAPMSQTTANLGLIVSSLQSSGSKVILGEQPLSQDYGAGYIQQFQAMFTALAQKYNVPLDTDLYRDITNIPGMLQEDGVHPTDDGYAQLAHNLLPLVQAALIKHPEKKRHH